MIYMSNYLIKATVQFTVLVALLDIHWIYGYISIRYFVIKLINK